MKRIFRKNQVIIAALAVMIAAAGYLNYSGRLFNDKDKTTETSGELANVRLFFISFLISLLICDIYTLLNLSVPFLIYRKYIPFKHH